MSEAKEKGESRLLAHDKEVVTPGEVLAEGIEYLPSHGTYRKGDRIHANQTGLLVVEGKVLKSIPLAGGYLPKRNDVVIGKVIDILMTGWRFNINSPYSAVLPLKDATFDYIKKGADLTSFFDLEEYVLCKIVQVTSQNLVDVSMKGPGLRKLKGGRIIKVNAAKVPRIIGKRGSMMGMIKNATGCQVTVGQNGLVWLSGEPADEAIAVEAIRKIEREAHVGGLTERMQAWLGEKTGKAVAIPSEQDIPDEYRDERRDGPREYSRDGPRDYARREERGDRRDAPRDGCRDGPRRDGPRRDSGRFGGRGFRRDGLPRDGPHEAARSDARAPSDAESSPRDEK